MKKDRIVQGSIVGIFVLLYVFVSLISTIHVIDFFEMTNPRWLSIALAIAFEFGAAASLAAIVVGDKTNKTIVWGLFFILTAFQMQGNMWYAYVNAQDYMSWMELFALNEEELIFQKRILAAVSGAVLPIVALGFIKSLVDYIKPEDEYSKRDIERIIEANENQSEPNDKLKQAAKEYFEDGNIPREKEDDTDEWDEDHALDMVMNQMVEDLQLDENSDLGEKRKVSEITKELIEEDKYSKDDETKDIVENITDEEVKEDIQTFGESLKKDEKEPSIDASIGIKKRIAE